MLYYKKFPQNAIIFFFFATLIFNQANFSYSEINANTEESMLIITENTADNNLAVSLENEINITTEIIDISPFDDLNVLFLGQNYFQKYTIIIMIINRISVPFNVTAVSQLETFIDNGGVFGIISTHIWKFTSSFHALLGLNISTGQKEWPLGNITGSITITIVNNTFCLSPYLFPNGSSFNLSAGIGISTSTKESYRVAISQTTPNGIMNINAFQKELGFIFAAPLSLIDTSSSEFLHLITSILKSSINLIRNNQSSTKSSEPPPLFPNLLISEEVIQIGLGLGIISFLLIGLSYIVYKWRTQLKIQDIPNDRSLITSIFLTPLLFIGHIVYPPILRRLDKYSVFEHETRKRILEILEERDFLHFRELKRELDNIGTSSLRWHLQVLEDFALIERHVFGQYEIYFLIRKRPNSEFLDLYFASISGIGFRVVKAFREMSSWDLTALSNYLETSKESIRYHCKKLEKINILFLNENRFYLNKSKEKLLIAVIGRRTINSSRKY